MSKHKYLWDTFADQHNIRDTWVPLFSTIESGVVHTKKIGTSNVRNILCRSGQMESLIIRECAKLVDDWASGTHVYDGLLYIMAIEDVDGIVPLYIGKAESYGKKAGNLSVNIKSVERDKSKFARWGDNYAYHIGDLSAVVLPGHDPKHIERKYLSWASELFTNAPNEHPVLKRPVYFWAKAWRSDDVGPWQDFGATRLTFLEYLLIGLTSSAFGERLLNREGHNRK
jgi:hypothetical protein